MLYFKKMHLRILYIKKLYKVKHRNKKSEQKYFRYIIIKSAIIKKS